MKVTIIDLETTGVETDRDRIVEISIRIVDGGPRDVCKGSDFTFVVNPQIEIPPEATAIHGIGHEHVKDAPPFASIASGVRDIVAKGDVVAGYNVRFDLDMLNAELERAKLEPLDLRRMLIVDPFALWRAFESRSLAHAFRRFVGDSFDGAHTAGADVDACARVLVGMVDAFALADDWNAIAEHADPDPDRKLWCGPSYHFVYKPDKGNTVFANFGPHKGAHLYWLGVHEPGFLKWIAGKDFPPHVKRLAEAARRATSGKHPTDVDDFYAWVRGQYG